MTDIDNLTWDDLYKLGRNLIEAAGRHINLPDDLRIGVPSMTVFEKIKAVAKVLKKKFPNLSTEETINLSEEIITALDDSSAHQG